MFLAVWKLKKKKNYLGRIKHRCTPGYHRTILFLFLLKAKQNGRGFHAWWLLMNNFRGISKQAVAFWCGLPQVHEVSAHGQTQVVLRAWPRARSVKKWQHPCACVCVHPIENIRADLLKKLNTDGKAAPCPPPPKNLQRGWSQGSVTWQTTITQNNNMKTTAVNADKVEFVEWQMIRFYLNML